MLLSLSYIKNTHLDVIQNKKLPTFGKAQQFDPFFYQQLFGLFQNESKSTKTQNDKIGPFLYKIGSSHSSSRAVLSQGDWSTFEFWASALISACSFVFPERSLSQSVGTLSLSHTVEVSVSLM